jgi:hypothetical protein
MEVTLMNKKMFLIALLITGQFKGLNRLLHRLITRCLFINLRLLQL